MKILCETSMRHVHLSKTDVEILFGAGATLECERELSQPGQFLVKDKRVNIVTAKSEFKNVAIIGPERKQSQVEISRTDSFALGLKNVPIRQSGELDGAPMIEIKTELGTVMACVIIAKRHLHIDPVTAQNIGIIDGQVVSIKINGERGGILGNVIARVSESFAPAVHIDSDEANALMPSDEVEVFV